MAGEDMIGFVLLKRTATKELDVLGHRILKTPEDWFECGIYVWKPVPAAASAAIKELRKDRHKRP
eukprot:2773300-Ditylum_brightwellii.AAC.1